MRFKPMDRLHVPWSPLVAWQDAAFTQHTLVLSPNCTAVQEQPCCSCPSSLEALLLDHSTMGRMPVPAKELPVVSEQAKQQFAAEALAKMHAKLERKAHKGDWKAKIEQLALSGQPADKAVIDEGVGDKKKSKHKKSKHKKSSKDRKHKKKHHKKSESSGSSSDSDSDSSSSSSSSDSGRSSDSEHNKRDRKRDRKSKKHRSDKSKKRSRHDSSDEGGDDEGHHHKKHRD